ncbi:1375_t:CDS:1, partial [Funneliformis geosporum]
DINVERIEKIVSPMNKCTNDLKSEFRIQTIKLYFFSENDDWNYKYDAVSKAKRYLKAECYLTRAQEILLGSSTCKTKQPPIAPDTTEALDSSRDSTGLKATN